MFDHHERRKDSKPDVVFSGIANGVIVRADKQRFCIGRAGCVAADHIAERIDLRGHIRRLHPLAQLRGNRAVCVGEIGAGQIVRRLGLLRQLIGQRNYSRSKCTRRGGV